MIRALPLTGRPGVCVVPDPEVRGLAPPLFMLLYAPSGISQGWIAVTLSFLLAQQGVRVTAIAGLLSLNLLPLTWKFLLGPAGRFLRKSDNTYCCFWCQ